MKTSLNNSIISNVKSNFSNVNYWKLCFVWFLIGATISCIFNSASYINLVINVNGSNSIHGGAIVSTMILISGTISAPIFGILTDKFKKYRLTLVLLLFCVAALCFTVLPWLNTTTLFWAIFTPTLGILYVYRNLNDSFATLKAENKNVSYGLTRSFFYIGYGPGSFINLLLLQNENLKSRPYYFFYFLGGLSIILMLCYWFFFHEPNLKQIKKSNKTELYKIKDLLKKRTLKTLAITIIIFSLVVGIFESQDFILQRIVINWSPQNSLGNDIIFKSYADLMAIIPYLVGFVFASWFLRKKGIKHGIVMTAILGFLQLFSLAIFLYFLKDKMNQSTTIKLMFDVLYAVGQGLFGAVMWTTFFEFFSILSAKKHRSKIVSSFSGMAYGVGTWFFVIISTQVLNQTSFSNNRVAILETSFAVVCLLSIFTIFFIENDLKIKLG